MSLVWNNSYFTWKENSMNQGITLKNISSNFSLEKKKSDILFGVETYSILLLLRK